MADVIPVGRRFTHIYTDKGEPVADSSRMRMRLSACCPSTGDLHNHLQRELGVYVPPNYSGPYGAGGVSPKFFQAADLHDVLDAVTLIYNFHRVERRTEEASGWLTSATRIFQEENIGYRIDEQGGVHFFVDRVFEVHRTAALASLNGLRYVNTLTEFDRAFRALDQVPPDGKSAIRSVFTATEGLFRLMFPNAPRLGAREIGEHLPPFIGRCYANDATARYAANKLISAFKEWVDAAHFYRHEQGQEEPAQPPHSVAVMLIDQGASIIRWLAELDSAAAAPTSTHSADGS